MEQQCQIEGRAADTRQRVARVALRAATAARGKVAARSLPELGRCAEHLARKRLEGADSRGTVGEASDVGTHTQVPTRTRSAGIEAQHLQRIAHLALPLTGCGGLCAATTLCEVLSSSC